MGQLAHFIEFLTLTRLWSHWLGSCPLSYRSPNAPSKAEVLDTWLLSILSGHKPYSHVTAIRCDGVNPGLLGMGKVVSEDALRNALKHIPEAEGTTWLDAHLSDSMSRLLDVPCILETDTTVKSLYGHQEGAVISYNPRKPGRPSHSYHTYLTRHAEPHGARTVLWRTGRRRCDARSLCRWRHALPPAERKYPYGEIEPFQHPRFGEPMAPTRYRPDIPGWLDNVLLKAVSK